MTVAAPGEARAREAFGAVARPADQLGLEERSMGMSDDLEAAVAAGSTMVRIGRGLFGRGRRPTRAEPVADRQPLVEADIRLSGRVMSSGSWPRGPQDLPGLTSRHYAVRGQEKECHPRS